MVAYSRKIMKIGSLSTYQILTYLTVSVLIQKSKVDAMFVDDILLSLADDLCRLDFDFVISSVRGNQCRFFSILTL